MIELNISVVFIIVSFLVLFFVLNHTLFKPFFAILEERKKRTEGSFKQAADMAAEVTRGREDYERRMKEAELKAQEEMASVRQSTVEEGRAIIEKTRAEADEELARIKDRIGAGKAATLKELRREAPSIGRNIAVRLLERSLPVIVFVCIALVPAAAMASEAAAEHEGGSGMIWKLINFAVLMGALYFAWKKVVSKGLDDRAVKIKSDMEEAARKKAEAEAKLAEYNAKLGELEGKIEEMRERIRQESEHEKQRLAREALEMAARLKEQARFTAEQEIKRAKDEIRKDVADLAVDIAREILSTEIKPEDQERLTKSYLEKLRLN